MKLNDNNILISMVIFIKERKNVSIENWISLMSRSMYVMVVKDTNY